MPLNKETKPNQTGDLSQERPKGPVYLATTPRCSGGCNSFPYIAPIYPLSLPYNA